MTTPHSVYRCYDKRGLLLCVGSARVPREVITSMSVQGQDDFLEAWTKSLVLVGSEEDS